VIGKPIAERLVQAGFEVAVHDVRPEPVEALRAAGATACVSAADVARRSDLVISLVSDLAQTHDVLYGANGLIDALRPGAIYATGSTLTPAPVREIARTLAARGSPTLDMPITGGYLAAYEGKLALMVGCDEATLARVRPALESFANVITRAGDIGAGQAAKLAHQLVMGVNVLALLEGLSLGVAGGVAPATMRQILRDGLANSTVLAVWDDLGPRWKDMLKPAPPDAPLPNLRKDLHSALELAREMALALPLAGEASAIADGGSATGHDQPQL